MANNQADITQAIAKAAAEATKAAVQAMAVAMSENSPGVTSEPVDTGPKQGGPYWYSPHLTGEQQTNTKKSKTLG